MSKTIHLLVAADSEEEAVEKTKDALQTYPDKVTTSGIRRITTEKANHWIPRDISVEVVETKGKTAA